MTRKVVILQHRLLHYRTQLFDKLRTACKNNGIELELVHGQASSKDLTKRDEGNLHWAHRVNNIYYSIGGRDLLWQPFPSSLRDANLVVIMQENRILSNYFLILSGLRKKWRVAYWGHGKNFQSNAPAGYREKWKNFLLTKVHWWFAYTQMSVDAITDAGFPRHRITSLENAIDTQGFKDDLASWSIDQVNLKRSSLNIPLDAPVGIFCGSLYPDKKLELMVAAADWIRQRRPDFFLIVIGDGPSMAFIKEAARERPWMRVLGVQKGRDKALYFRMGDIMFNPGSVGLHIVDAFCSGLVLATTSNARHGPEAVYLRNSENGIFSGDSVVEYGGAVLDVINTPDRLQKMKQASLLDSERYTLDNMVARFVDGIDAALRDA